jgi:hypothetical protein
MKNALFTLLLISSSFVTLAQSPTFAWAKRWGWIPWGQIGQVFAYDMVVDDNENSYVISQGNTLVNFNPLDNPQILGPTSSVLAISKFSSDGTLIWVKFIKKVNISGNSSAGVLPYKLAIKNNQLYITGKYFGTVNFDPNNSFQLSASESCFLLNMNTDGVFNWVKSFSSVIVNDIDIDNSNNVILAGSFLNSMSISSSISVSSVGGTDAFVAKWDINGNPQWLKGYGQAAINEADEALGIDCSSQDEIYVVGGYRNTVDFDPGVGVLNYSSQGEEDIFVQKFTSTGDLIWAKSIGSTSTDRANSICVDNQGSIIFTGALTGTVDFDPSPSVSNAITPTVNAFVCKWSENAVFQWVKTINSSNSNPQGKFIFHDLQNNYYIAGIGGGTGTSADYNPSNSQEFILTSPGAYSTFILKLNEQGLFNWAGILELQSSFINFASWPASIFSSSTGIYLSGAFKGTMDVNTDPNVITNISSSTNSSSYPDYSAYVLKLNQCLSTSNTLTTSSCSSYTAPDGQVFTQSGQYASTLTNSAGCDSLITINLTILQPSSSSISETACKEYIAPDGQVYTQSGSYTSVISNAAGCDSTINIALTINTITAGISQNGIELSSTTNGAQYQWIRCESNSPISEATSQNFTAIANGQYAVVVTQNNCSDTSDCVSVNSVGVNELNFGNVIIYPNPVRDIIHLSIASDLVEYLVITNVIGELLISGQHVNALNVSQLAPGLYELIFVIDGQKNVQRFIKE